MNLIAVGVAVWPRFPSCLHLLVRQYVVAQLLLCWEERPRGLCYPREREPMVKNVLGGLQKGWMAYERPIWRGPGSRADEEADMLHGRGAMA